jgi:pimeloyl-ACP methyl ester carboxylesterase
MIDDDLSGLRCRVLAIHGDHDEYGTLRHPERIATLAPVYGQAAIVADCGHTPHREKPDDVLRVLRAFLESN